MYDLGQILLSVTVRFPLFLRIIFSLVVALQSVLRYVRAAGSRDQRAAGSILRPLHTYCVSLELCPLDIAQQQYYHCAPGKVQLGCSSRIR